MGNVATEKGGAALLTSFGNFRLATKGGSLHAEGNSAREGGAFLVELQSQLTLPPEVKVFLGRVWYALFRAAQY